MGLIKYQTKNSCYSNIKIFKKMIINNKLIKIELKKQSSRWLPKLKKMKQSIFNLTM